MQNLSNLNIITNNLTNNFIFEQWLVGFTDGDGTFF
jgi:hypothetical protein